MYSNTSLDFFELVFFGWMGKRNFVDVCHISRFGQNDLSWAQLYQFRVNLSFGARRVND